MNTTPAIDKSNHRVRQMFGQIAPHYDRMNHLLSMNVDHYWRWLTVRKLMANGVTQILDVCTGTGDLAFAFHRRSRGRVQVVGTDFCPEMLQIAREKSIKKKADRSVKFHEADAQALPFDNNSFDVVTIAFGLRNVESTERGLAELVRVCRPQGRVGVLEFSSPRRWPIKGLYRWYFQNVLPRIGQRFAKNELNAYDYLPQSVGAFPAYEALANRMSQAGLNNVVFFPLTFGIATLYLGTK